ncbi:hypothetical protein ECE50_029615 [Chitinophaga sp. Mgbs1]|uniref:Fungal lipase-type domain-containing protein n=1 Tax=Chitinophaga solisilvae TaxID=1233460 RepID=A0A3S1CMI0_9BACT|nr:hypothetical protein [Chitinophaga solisilvae]
MNSENNIALGDLAPFVLPLCYIASSQDPVNNIKKLDGPWEMIWRNGDASDPNFFYVAKNDTQKLVALIIRGSVISKGIFSEWDAFVDWIVEDLSDELVYWPFTSDGWNFTNGEPPCIGAGSYILLSQMINAKNKMEGKAADLLHKFLFNFSKANPSYQLVIGGHSLGGNTAKVYTSFYLDYLSKIEHSPAAMAQVSLCTFAAPASGNVAFSNDLDAKLTQQIHYQNTSDVVPFFPTYSGMDYVKDLYHPHPSAHTIEIGKDPFGGTIFLSAAIMMLAGKLKALNYKEPNMRYLKPLNIKVIEKEGIIENNALAWMGQAGAQHQIGVYAAFLNIPLPKIDTAISPDNAKNKTTEALAL